MIELKELHDRLKLKYDPDELVDMLHITVDDIIEHFGHRVILYRDNFVQDEYWEDENE